MYRRKDVDAYILCGLVQALSPVSSWQWSFSLTRGQAELVRVRGQCVSGHLGQSFVRTLAKFRSLVPALHPAPPFWWILILESGSVPIPLIHFNYFDFLKPPGRWRTNSWIYLIRNFILSESLGINTLHFMGCSVLLDEPKVSIQMKSWSRAWLWSSENNQCSKKPLCL